MRARGDRAGAPKRWMTVTAPPCPSSNPARPAGLAPTTRWFCRLQRTQKVENVLLLVFPEVVEVPDHCIRLRGVTGKDAPALVRRNRLQQVRGSSIMQEEKPLPQPPQRGGPELSGARLSLRDPIGEPRAHVVDQDVGEEMHGLIA